MLKEMTMMQNKMSELCVAAVVLVMLVTITTAAESSSALRQPQRILLKEQEHDIILHDIINKDAIKQQHQTKKCVCQRNARRSSSSRTLATLADEKKKKDSGGGGGGDGNNSSNGFGNADPVPQISVSELPEVFDWSNVMGVNFLLPSWNQHIPTYCGSCYAHGTLAAVQDRIKISKQGRYPDVTLSRQSFINCGPVFGFGAGCHGGNAEDIYNFMHEIGLPDETCNNYAAHSTQSNCTLDSVGMCMNCMVEEDESGKLVSNCWPVEKYTRYYIKDWGEVTGEEQIMNELFQRGPVTCGIISAWDFDFGYDGGVFRSWADVYQQVDKKTGLPYNVSDDDINHDVEITGWGVTEDGVKFWQLRNSWGTYWGEHGFFKYERGIDLNMVESACSFGIPDAREELNINNGKLTGSMYGLKDMVQDSTPAVQRRTFREDLHGNDWSLLPMPPMLGGLEVGLTGQAVTTTTTASMCGGNGVGVGGGGGGDGDITDSNDEDGGGAGAIVKIGSASASGDVATEVGVGAGKGKGKDNDDDNDVNNKGTQKDTLQNPAKDTVKSTTADDEDDEPAEGDDQSGGGGTSGFLASVFLLDPVAVALGVFMGVAIALLSAIIMLVVARRRRANYELLR